MLAASCNADSCVRAISHASVDSNVYNASVPAFVSVYCFLYKLLMARAVVFCKTSY